MHFVSSGWHRGGWVGVDLFFVLSGFLVSGLLFREHGNFGVIAAKQFLIRRGFKIYPAFWVFMAVTVAEAFLLHGRFHPKAVLSELLFVQNYAFPHWNHTWSLAVEEHFYILLLLLLLFLGTRDSSNPFRSVPKIFAVIGIFSLSGRLLTSSCAGPSLKALLLPSHLRMDSLFCGVFVSYLYHYHRTHLLAFGKRHRLLLLTVGLLVLSPAFFLPIESTPSLLTFGLTAFYLGSACILIACLSFHSPRSSALNATAYVGSHSYSIYLWHMPVLLWVMPALAAYLRSWPLFCGAYLACATIAGISMAAAIEFPLLRLRDRWFPTRASPLR